MKIKLRSMIGIMLSIAFITVLMPTEVYADTDDYEISDDNAETESESEAETEPAPETESKTEFRGCLTSERIKVGDYYFWKEGERTWNNYRIKMSKTENGKGKTIIKYLDKEDKTKTMGASVSGYVVIDKNGVLFERSIGCHYYDTEQTYKLYGKICYYDIKTKKAKSISDKYLIYKSSSKTPDSYNYEYLGCYNNYAYYSCSRDDFYNRLGVMFGEPKKNIKPGYLFKVNIKTGKIKTLIKGDVKASYIVDDSNIYYTKFGKDLDKRSSKKCSIYKYDLKTKKSTKIISKAQLISHILSYDYDEDKNELCYLKNNKLYKYHVDKDETSLIYDISTDDDKIDYIDSLTYLDVYDKIIYNIKGDTKGEYKGWTKQVVIDLFYGSMEYRYLTSG